MSKQRMLHLTFVAGGVAVCVLAIRGAILTGYARSLAGDGKNNLSFIDQAVRLSPNDPELYVTRATYAVSHGEFNAAIADLQKAIDLRPGDHKLWIQLGQLLEKSEHNDLAMEAFSRAEALAPFYAAPHWEKAKLFQKLGQENETFDEYRKASSTNPTLFNEVIAIAWESSGSDVSRMRTLVAPKTDSEKLIFARFLIDHGKAVDALPVIRSVADLSFSERRQLLRYLLEQKEFTVAYELWSDAPPNADPHPMQGSIPDSGFESGRLYDDAGFAWTSVGAEQTKVFIDGSIHLNGNRSLRIDWTGGPEPSNDVISLLVLVQPDANYMLNFAARSHDVISGVAPILTVSDAKVSEGPRPSVALPVGTSDWQQVRLVFKTGPSTRAIRIGLQKQSCKDALCPIFGTHWLDDFVLSRLAA